MEPRGFPRTPVASTTWTNQHDSVALRCRSPASTRSFQPAGQASPRRTAAASDPHPATRSRCIWPLCNSGSIPTTPRRSSGTLFAGSIGVLGSTPSRPSRGVPAAMPPILFAGLALGPCHSQGRRQCPRTRPPVSHTQRLPVALRRRDSELPLGVRLPIGGGRQRG